MGGVKKYLWDTWRNFAFCRMSKNGEKVVSENRQKN